MKEDEYVSYELFMSEYANETFWGRTPYLIGVYDGMIFAYENMKKTIGSGATPDLKIIKLNIKSAIKQRNSLESEMLRGDEENNLDT